MSDDLMAILASSRTDRVETGRPHLWPLIIIVLVLLSVAVGVLGKRDQTPIEPTTSGTPERESRIYTVSYRFGVYSPTNLRIHAGDTVRFRNDSPLPIRVIAQLQPGQRVPEFDSTGTIAPDSYFSYTFASKGIYGYNTYGNENESGIILVR